MIAEAPSASAVSRRGFVGLGAGAAFAVANAGAAAAQTEGFGKPHPPIVAQNDPAITVSQPRLAPAGASAIGAYAAVPKTLTRTTPGVVLVQAIWGVDEQLQDVVRRLAKSGFITIAPRLFDRVGAPDGSGTEDLAKFRPAAEKMTAEGHARGDLLAAREWVKHLAPAGKVGIMGFCMGGGIVLQTIVAEPAAFDAASIFYGNVRPGTPSGAPTTASTFDYTSRLRTPTLGSYGGRDTSIKAEDVTAAFARMKQPHAVKIYDEAGHAFFDDERTSYVATAATDAWSRTLAWFHRYLG